MDSKSLPDKLASYFRQRHLFLFTLILEAALLLNIGLASWVNYPGVSDPVHYYTVAENLVDGRGFEVDYIWNYLSKPATITHSSNDYWVPLTSIIISGSLLLFGKSLFAALIPSVLFALALAVLTYYLAKAYAGSHFVALYAAGLTYLVPSVFLFSSQTDTSIYYMLIAALALFCMIKGAQDPRFFLPAAVAIGLAELTRLDGVLLLPVLLVTILFSPQSRRTKLIYTLLALLLFMLVLSPWLIGNYRTFGSFFPSDSQKTAFLTDYRDIASYSKDLSLSSYLSWGIGNIIWSKLRMVVYTVKTFYELFGHVLWILALVGLVDLLRRPEERRKWRSYLPPLLFLGVLLAFYIVVATFPAEHGSFRKSAAVLIPFFVIWAVAAIERRLSSKIVAAFILTVLALILLFESLLLVAGRIEEDRVWIQQLTEIKAVLQAEGRPDVTVMTRYPWDVYYVTRYKAIQIPNDDLETIYQVAQRYRAEYLLLPAPREALIPIYEGRQTDARFVLIATIPNSEWKIFRLELGPGGP